MFYCQAGYYFTWLYAQHQAKEEMKEQLVKNLPDEMLEAIPLTGNTDNIKWEEEGKEFSLNGEMYDVVRTRTVKGKTVLYCMNDKKERDLLSHLSNTVQSSHQNNGKQNKALFLKLASDPAIIAMLEFTWPETPHENYFTSYDIDFPVRPELISSPPPKA